MASLANFKTKEGFLSYRQSYNQYVKWDEYKRMRQGVLANPEEPEVECWGCINIIVKYNDDDDIVDTKVRETVGASSDRKNMRDLFEITNFSGGTGEGD